MRFSRRRFQIGTRTLLALVLVLSIALAAWTERARRQEEFVRRVVMLGGGYVVYEHEMDAAGKRVANPVAGAPKWMRRLMGDHYFFRIRQAGSSGLQDDDLRLISGFTSIELLQLSDRIGDEGLAQLSGLVNLKTLEIESPRITDHGVAHLARMHNLEMLVLSNARISDDGLKHLAGLTRLKQLYLPETQITAAGAAWLKQALPNTKIEPTWFPSAEAEKETVQRLIKIGARFHADGDGYLVRISLYETGVGDHDLQLIEPLSRLQQLALHNTRVTSAGVARLRASHPDLKVFPDLRSARKEEADAVALLQGCGARLTFRADGFVRHVALVNELLDDEALNPLAQLRNLEGLEIFSTRITDQGLRRLVAVDGLKSLSVPRAALSDEGLASLASLPNLNRIWLQGAGITDRGLMHFARVQHLRNLTLRGTSITGSGLSHLSDKLDLIELDLSGGRVRGEALVHLRKLPNLKKLTLNLCEVGDAGVEQLILFEALESLSLSETRITDAGLMRLVSLPNLRNLHVEHSRVTADGLTQFRARRPQCKVRR